MDPDTIKALIQKYQAEVEFRQEMIRHLQADLASAGGVVAQAGAATPDRNNQKPAKERHVGDAISSVRDYQFYNKSQPEAAEQLLEMVGHPLSIAEIVEGLEKGHLTVGGAGPAEKRQNLATVLARSGRFGKAARGTWGLPTWPKVEPVKRSRGGKAEEGEAATAEAAEAGTPEPAASKDAEADGAKI